MITAGTLSDLQSLRVGASVRGRDRDGGVKEGWRGRVEREGWRGRDGEEGMERERGG